MVRCTQKAHCRVSKIDVSIEGNPDEVSQNRKKVKVHWQSCSARLTTRPHHTGQTESLA